MREWLAYIARSKSSNQQIAAYARLHATLDDFATRPVVGFDRNAAAEFERMLRLKLRIGTMDLRIAAIAIAQNSLLLSKNLTDFRKVPVLRVEDWTV
jgi:tRNA(fMet)-specific endonuclease VapC